MTFALDNLPNSRVGPAMAILRKLRTGEPFRAPIGTPESVAVLDLVRARLVEIDGGGTVKDITVRPVVR